MGLLNAESWWSPCSVSPLISDPVVAVLWIYPCPVTAQLFRVVQMSPCEKTGVSGQLDWSVLFFPPMLSRQRPSPGCSGLSPYSDSSTPGPSYQNNKLIFQSFQTGPAPVKVSYTVREQCHFSASVSLDKVNQNLN